MLPAIAALLLCQLVVLICGVVLLPRWIARKQEDIERRLNETVHSWVDSPGVTDEGKPLPSKMAEVLEVMGVVVGSAAARSLRASLQQQASSQAQVANGALDQLQGAENPLLGLLAGGRRGKGAAIQALALKLWEMFPKGGAGNGHSESIIGRLGKE